MNMELQTVAPVDIVDEMTKDNSGLSLTNLETLAKTSLRRAFASKVIWMSKQFKKIESVEEIGAWGKTMNFLCKSMIETEKFVGDEEESTCLKVITTTKKVLMDDVQDDVHGCFKNTSDLEKSDSLNVGKAESVESSEESEDNVGKDESVESSEESEDELSALSDDGGLKEEQTLSEIRTSKCLLAEVQVTPNKEDKTSNSPPAIDFGNLSLGSTMPKVRIVPSLPSPFFGRAGGKGPGWRRNSFSAGSKMYRVKSNPGTLNGYFSADEGSLTTQLTF